MKILTQYGDPEGAKISITASFVARPVEFTSNSQSKSKDLSFTAISQQPVLFETSFGNFSHSISVLKFLSNSSDIYPADPRLQLQIDEALETIKEDLEKPLKIWLDMVFGRAQKDPEKLKKSQLDVKKFLFIADQRLKKQSHLIGDFLTIADISLASSLVWPYRALFDEKYRKPLAALNTWFVSISSLPYFKQHFGTVKLAKVALEIPDIFIEQPELVDKKNEAEIVVELNQDEESEENEDEEIEPTGPDPYLLFPSTIGLDKWKKLFINAKEKKSTLPYFWDNFDRTKWSVWFLSYEKIKGEGEKVLPFENLLDGFIQDLHIIRRNSFGALGIYGQVPNLEIRGCLLMRGQEVLKGLLEHQQFEFWKTRKADWENRDRELIEEYWGNVEEGAIVEGLELRVIRFWR